MPQQMRGPMGGGMFGGGGGGMFGGFLGGGFGRAMEMGAGIGLGEDIINSIFERTAHSANQHRSLSSPIREVAEVLGWSEERSSQAELVSVPVAQLTAKPPSLAWEVAGSLFVAGMAAYGSVLAVAPQPGETVVVSAAAGGVGSIAVQLARRTGANVIGLAGEHNHDWLRAHDVIPVVYGEGQEERLTEASGGQIDAFIDTFGGGYVELAIGLGIAPERINTIADFAAVERYGVQSRGTHAVATPERLAELAALVVDGSLDVTIARVYPLDQVREAFRELEQRHTQGKIVLVP